ncbi:hypothetical protein CQ14_37535 [Bradyrhizobium lablabi]|uniref:Uncharacterized protein n=1 Tax=Bradyrhizobium lablabi TaxID=722472 RepID=A0A0R3MCI3_9BRAD|nr:molybdate ABC transporter substrate-binding protein [Bradyrhizobium lablabi]KRR17801.1 hypothetical protein CQ14_37535 [Bradyrhizobium lablabi]
MILTADDSHPKKLVENGFAVREGRLTHASGNLVLWSRTAKFVNGFDTFRTASILKLQICNSAPALYGAAVEAMKAIDAYEGMQPKLVEGATITQAYQFIKTVNAELSAAPLPQLADSKSVSRWLVPQEFVTRSCGTSCGCRLTPITERRAPKGPGSLLNYYASMTMCSNS